MSKIKEQIKAAITARGLVSVMNDTKWAELQHAVRNELPFSPPYQLKVVLNNSPHPESFDRDVGHFGDWSDECLRPFFEIEWIRVRPRYLHGRGRLLSPETRSVEAEFLTMLHRFHIPFRRDGASIWIYGYASNTSGLACDNCTKPTP